MEIIDNYRDLHLKDYIDIVAISKDESLEELDKQVKIISILTGADEGTILNLPIMEYKELAARSAFLEGELPDGGRILESYRCGDYNLIPTKDIRKVTTAQYIDFQTFHQAGIDEHLVEIISCLLVPKGKKYNDGYDIIDVQNAIRESLSTYEAVSLYAFFLASCSKSMRDMLISSLKALRKLKDRNKRMTMEKEIRKQLTILDSGGDGLQM